MTNCPKQYNANDNGFVLYLNKLVKTDMLYDLRIEWGEEEFKKYAINCLAFDFTHPN